ncbi:hypothetical protein [Halobacillus litoralis]|uniref:hypothetical protein n=1 Tax=Halobacillus litoralis TaxID=45668 RepID=UPI002491E366|nr:hypothetical protein [Halobacillus litoralis]
MEEALEKESIDQISIRNKERKSAWYLFLTMALCIGVGQQFLDSVPGLIYLGAVVFYAIFLYETYMSRKTNKELWKLWEERWSEHKRLFQLRSSFGESLQVFLPAILMADYSGVMSIIFGVIALVTGFRSGDKKWRAKQHYYEEFQENNNTIAA